MAYDAEPGGDPRGPNCPKCNQLILPHQPTTLMQAVSLARGADPKLANIHRVAIFRTINGERRSAFYDLTQIRSGHTEDPQVYGSDIIVVDTSGTKNFFQNFQGGFGLLGMLIRPW